MSKGKIAPTLRDYIGEPEGSGVPSPVVAACDLKAMRAELRALLAVARAAEGMIHANDVHMPYLSPYNEGSLRRALSRLKRASGTGRGRHG